MGIILSRFRKKKTTVELLDDIEQRIRSIEKFHKETEQRFRRVIGKMIVFSILFYAIALCGYYYYYSPDKFRENMLNFVPLLVFPILILMSRKMVSWYYRRKLSKNETTLKTLKTNKKKILDEVMDKEIYKVAKEILEKYAPEQLNSNLAKNPTSNGNSKALVIASQTPQRSSTARQRLTPSNTIARRLESSPAPSPGSNMSGDLILQPRLSLTRPILPRDRGAFDKLVDMIIGDGPSNRYALICRVCCSHNGMALKHEFDYIAFRCAYCMQWNPARKQKPPAPNLALESASNEESDTTNNSDPETAENTLAAISAESHEDEDIGVSSELIALDTTNESTDSASTNAPVETEAIDDDGDVAGKNTADVETASPLDPVHVSALRKALDELDIDDARSAVLPDAAGAHLESTNPAETVHTES